MPALMVALILGLALALAAGFAVVGWQRARRQSAEMRSLAGSRETEAERARDSAARLTAVEESTGGVFLETDAEGRLLAGRGPLPSRTLLLGLPRGGVVVAAAMARLLHCPLRSWSVRKIADPSWPELAIGAIAGDDVSVWREGPAGPQQQRARRCGWLQAEARELQRRRRLYGDPPAAELQGRPLLVVDDGIATGMTVRAALISLASLGPSALLLAVPVVEAEVQRALLPLVDRLEALAVVEGLGAVGLWYERFEQLTDQQVRALLAPSWVERAGPGEG